jgi:hypothetical protein
MNNLETLDHATSRRLARLAAMPMETARLERSLQSTLHLARPEPQFNWLRRGRAIAAIIVIGLATWGIILAVGSRPAIASSAEIATWHRDMLTTCAAVNSLTEANRILRECDQYGSEIPGAEQHACCVKMAGKHRVSCVMIEQNGEMLMLCTAKQSDVQTPGGKPQSVNGVDFTSHTQGPLNIVTINKDGRWLCAAGRQPPEQLATTLAAVR